MLVHRPKDVCTQFFIFVLRVDDSPSRCLQEQRTVRGKRIKEVALVRNRPRNARQVVRHHIAHVASRKPLQ